MRCRLNDPPRFDQISADEAPIDGASKMTATLEIEQQAAGPHRPDDPPDRAGLRELRRRRLGAGVLRPGPERAGGDRADGRRLGAGDHPLRHRRRVRRRPQRGAIGRWIKARGVRPALTTKTYNPMDTGADHGLAPARINRQFESSLERLGVDRVELYLAHEFDPEVPLADTIGAFETLAADGRIGAYGVSNFDAPQLEASLAAGEPQAIQNAYSLLERDDERGGVAAVRASPGLLFGVRAAVGRVADRQVPPRRAVSRRLADDPAPRALRAADLGPHVRRARPARGDRARARELDGRGRAGVAARGRPRRPRSSSARGGPSTSSRSARRSPSR